MDNDIIAYIAGFFDGDGHVSLTKLSDDAAIPHYALAVGITQTERGILDWIQKQLDAGTVTSARKGPTKEYPNRKATWQLRFYGRDAEAVLKIIKPYLRVKQLRAELGLKFATQLNGRLVREAGKRQVSTSPDLQAEREKVYVQMQTLNHRGI